MTATDKIYFAVMETAKEYSMDQAVEALFMYIMEGKARYFTSSNNARKLVMTISPAEVLSDIFKMTLKHELIMKKDDMKGPNSKLINLALNEYGEGKTITAEISLNDSYYLFLELLKTDISLISDLLIDNPNIFKTYIAQMVILLANNHDKYNKISNEKFTYINSFFGL